jgi:hypothetical protein
VLPLVAHQLSRPVEPPAHDHHRSESDGPGSGRYRSPYPDPVVVPALHSHRGALRTAGP